MIDAPIGIPICCPTKKREGTMFAMSFNSHFRCNDSGAKSGSETRAKSASLTCFSCTGILMHNYLRITFNFQCVFSTPPETNMERKHGWFGSMFLLFHGCIFRFQPLVFGGANVFGFFMVLIFHGSPTIS